MLRILGGEGLVTVERRGRRIHVIFNNIGATSRPILKKLVCLSVPGRRVPIKWDALRNYKQGNSFVIIGTSTGLLKDQYAIRRRKAG